MLSISESAEVGGLIGRSIATYAVPIPGAGIVIAPVAANVGEAIGRNVPSYKRINDVPEFMRDSVRIYQGARENNLKIDPTSQFKARKRFIKKARELGYNQLGQTIAAIDPGTLSIIPNNIIKRDENLKRSLE